MKSHNEAGIALASIPSEITEQLFSTEPQSIPQ